MMMEQRRIIVDDILTSYLTAGSGRVIVCLHGWGDSSSTFQVLIDSLSAHYRVIAIDLPGFGHTDKPPKPWSLDDYSDFVAKFLQKIRVKSPYALIGHSNGGAITIRGLSKRYLTAEKVVLIATAGIRTEFKTKKRILRVTAKLGKIITMPLPAHVKARVKRRAYSTIGSDLFVAEDMQETFKNIISDDVTADAAKIATDTLLIYGDTDTATPPRYGEVFNSLMRHSELHIIPKSGHFVHHDNSTHVNTIIRDFLK